MLKNLLAKSPSCGITFYGKVPLSEWLLELSLLKKAFLVSLCQLRQPPVRQQPVTAFTLLRSGQNSKEKRP